MCVHMRTHLPEPLHNVAVRRAVLQPGVVPPVLHVHRAQTRHDQLQLTLVKGLEEVGRDELVEAFLQGVELLVDAHLEAPLHVEMHVLFLVLIGDRDVLAVGLEIVVGDAAEFVMFHAEGAVKHAFYVVLTVGTGGGEGERVRERNRVGEREQSGREKRGENL